MDDIIDVDSPEQRIAMRRRHLQLGLRMQAIACVALQELEQKVAAGMPLGLTAEDAKALLDAGAKLERAAVGDEGRDADDATTPAPKKPN